MIDVRDDGHVADVLHIAFFNLAAKVLQVERNGKQKGIFACISSTQPTFAEGKGTKKVSVSFFNLQVIARIGKKVYLCHE